jgi:hypothetical protein
VSVFDKCSGGIPSVVPDDEDVLNGLDNPVLAELAERIFAKEDFPSNYLHPEDRVACSFCGQRPARKA